MSRPPPTRTQVCNVLVIGAGAAGMRAALAAHGAGVQVVVLGKRTRKDAHTVLAAGGINAALGTVDPEDSWQQHFADTWKEGYFLAHPRAVELLTREAPAAVEELVSWGCELARLPDGRLAQRYFGAHRYRRTCFAGDYTGRAVLFALADQLEARGLPVLEHAYVSRLLVHEGRCFGALSFHLGSGERTVHFADAVVLATGGHTRLWRKSSSRRDENTGDGLSLALEAGCRVANLELVQFHPTGMVHPEELAGTLVTEAVRGEGGRLYNAKGERFMERYDSERLELSARDRVALACYTEIKEGRGGPHGGVFLDISHRDKKDILERLPRMYRQFLEYQLRDISKEPMEVAPTAHYSMGGVVVEPETQATGVEGLYAVGEVTSGLHGANRLGGNSLAETVVFGRRAGEAAARFSRESDVQLRSRREVARAQEELDGLVREGERFSRLLQRELRDAMWEDCGVVREGEGLERGLERVRALGEALAEVDVRPTSEGYGDLAQVLDLRGSLRAAELTLRGARERRESRGAHQRADFPGVDPALQVHFVFHQDAEGRLVLEREPVPEVPEHLRAWARQEDEVEVEVAGRLLE